MSADQENAVTVTDALTPVTDIDIAKLYKGLNVLNVSIENLSKASILNKGAAADATLNAARDLLANQNFTIHKIFNNLSRVEVKIENVLNFIHIELLPRLSAVEEKIESISNIGVIKNG